MKRILYAMIFGYIFGAVVFGQQPGNVEFQPLANFDGFFDGITEWFTDSLGGGWLLFISLFFVWVSYWWLIKILDYKSVESVTEDEVENDCLRDNFEEPMGKDEEYREYKES